MATAMNGGVNSFASFYLSSYRVGTNSRVMTDDERDFLKCAVDQLSSAMKLSPAEPGRIGIPNSVSLLVSESGIGLLGLSSLREQFGEIWPRWTGDHLPEQLSRLVGKPGIHILPDRQLVVKVEATPRFQGMGLWRLSLRRLNKIDLLTNREKQVARQLCTGQSAKEVAQSLGIAPATVRNQTQSIYQKLEVDNRAALAALVNAP
jgi:DNA-binding CsgD family transcriptional regulator